MAKVRITRFSRHTRYAILVPNRQLPFNPKATGRIAHFILQKLEQPVQLTLPFSWEADGSWPPEK
jgi:hypothetical protein